jgi:hypothetical protein
MRINKKTDIEFARVGGFCDRGRSSLLSSITAREKILQHVEIFGRSTLPQAMSASGALSERE